MKRHTNISKILDTKDSRENVLRLLIQDQNLPDRQLCYGSYAFPGRLRCNAIRRRFRRLVEIQQVKDRIGLCLLKRGRR